MAMMFRGKQLIHPCLSSHPKSLCKSTFYIFLVVQGLVFDMDTTFLNLKYNPVKPVTALQSQLLHEINFTWVYWYSH